jgi:mercuric ion binding protein
MKRLVALVLSTVVAPSLWAATQTTTLKIPGMTCPTCPITVKRALQRVDGVSKIAVNYPQKEVVVIFDDARTDEKALVKATSDVGFPSQPVATAK